MGRRFAVVVSLLALVVLLAVALIRRGDEAIRPIRIRNLRVVPAMGAVRIEWTSDRPVVTAVSLLPLGDARREVHLDDEPRRRHRLVLKDLPPGRVHRVQVLADGRPCGREESFTPRSRIEVDTFRVVEEPDGARIVWTTSPPCRCEISYRLGGSVRCLSVSTEEAAEHVFLGPGWDERLPLKDFVVTCVDAVGHRHVEAKRRIAGLEERWAVALEGMGRAAFLDEMVRALLGPNSVSRARERLARFGVKTLVERILAPGRRPWDGPDPWGVCDSLVELRMIAQLAHHRRRPDFLPVTASLKGFLDEAGESLIGEGGVEIFRMRFPKWQDVFFPANRSERELERAKEAVALVFPVDRVVRRRVRFAVHVEPRRLESAKEAELELSGYQFYTNYLYEFRHSSGRRFLLGNPNREDDVPITVTLSGRDGSPSLNVQRRRWMRFPVSFFDAGENEIEMTLLAVGPGGSLLSTVQDLVIRLR